MKKTSLLIVCTVLCMQLFGQKLNTKDFKVEAPYLQLPSVGLDPSFNTYHITVNGDAAGLSRHGYTLTDAKKAIALEGYQLVPGGGSVVIQTTIGVPTAGETTLSTVDKFNTEEKWKEYSYYNDVAITSSYKLMDYKGNTIDEKVIAESERFSTASYRQMEDLKSAYAKEYPARLNEKLKSMLYANVQSIRNSINNTYGFPAMKRQVEFETLNSKEHPDMPKYAKIKETVEKAFLLIKPASNSEFIAAIQPAIDFWLQEEKKYDANLKEERKLNYALRQNLGTAYYWMGDYDQAAVFFNKIAQGDVSANSGRDWVGHINKIKSDLKRINRSGQHFTLVATDEEKLRSASSEKERDALYASGDVRKFEDFDHVLGVTSSSKVEPAVMYYKDGKKEEGYLVYEARYPVPDFRQPQYIRFGKAKDRSVVANSLDYLKLDSMRINHQIFYVKDISLRAGIINLAMKNAILEPVKDYKRTTLMIVHPPFMHAKGILGSGGDEMEPNIAVLHKTTKEYMVPEDLMGFAKGMTRIVEDCPAAVTYLKEKKATPPVQDERLKRFLDTDRMVESLRLYDTCGN